MRVRLRGTHSAETRISAWCLPVQRRVKCSVVLSDHGERRSGVPAKLRRLGIDVRPMRLPAGDYVVSDRVVIERKGPSDLAASFKDRRIFEQLARLAEAYPSVVLVVEGQRCHAPIKSRRTSPGRRRATQQKEVRPATRSTASKRVSSPPAGTFSPAVSDHGRHTAAQQQASKEQRVRCPAASRRTRRLRDQA
jgi:ERCC4-type nuclease